MPWFCLYSVSSSLAPVAQIQKSFLVLPDEPFYCHPCASSLGLTVLMSVAIFAHSTQLNILRMMSLYSFLFSFLGGRGVPLTKQSGEEFGKRLVWHKIYQQEEKQLHSAFIQEFLKTLAVFNKLVAQGDLSQAKFLTSVLQSKMLFVRGVKRSRRFFPLNFRSDTLSQLMLPCFRSHHGRNPPASRRVWDEDVKARGVWAARRPDSQHSSHICQLCAAPKGNCS